MVDNWKTTTIGELATLQRGFDISKKEQTDGTVPVISSGGIGSYHNQAKHNGPGVLLGRKGTLGSVYWTDKPHWPHSTTLWVKDFHGNDPKFIYYFFKAMGPELLRMDVGAANPTLNRNHVHPLPALRPPLCEQKRISQILGRLDDKIELNTRMNATLEAIARALFQSWFVDFDPVRKNAEGGNKLTDDSLFPDSFEDSELGEVPNGWKVLRLDNIATYLNGLALQKFPPGDGETLPVIKIAQLRKGDSSGADRCNTDVPRDYVVQDGDVLFSWSGSLEVELWCGGRGALNQHLFKVTSSDFPKWFYYLWTLHHLDEFRLIAASKATTMGHIQRKHLTEARVLVPSRPLLNRMSEIITPIVDRIIANRIQSRTLATLRDTLLPNLLCGKF